MGKWGLRTVLVTLLFTDIDDGVRLWEADRDAMAAASARYDRIVREQIEASGGHVFKAVGEAHRAVFADPLPHFRRRWPSSGPSAPSPGRPASPPPADNADWTAAMNDYVTVGEDYSGDNMNEQDDTPAQASQEIASGNSALASFNAANGGVLNGTIQS
jgi:class 3 adenylate cyclase